MSFYSLWLTPRISGVGITVVYASRDLHIRIPLLFDTSLTASPSKIYGIRKIIFDGAWTYSGFIPVSFTKPI
jgi:hypothetical protein